MQGRAFDVYMELLHERRTRRPSEHLMSYLGTSIWPQEVATAIGQSTHRPSPTLHENHFHRGPDKAKETET
jgi:hypothetical protein